MPHTGPDFGGYAPREVTAGLSDMGELAVRLGSIVSYDRRGIVVDMDDFEGVLIKGEVSAPAAPGYICLDSTYARSGSQSVKFHLIFGADGQGSIVRYHPVVGSRRLGIEFSFFWDDIYCYLDLALNYYDGALAHAVALRLDPTTLELSIQDSLGAFKVIATGVTPIITAGAFNTLKLVVDFNTDFYQRVMLNSESWDISDEAIKHDVPTTDVFIQDGIQFTSNTLPGNNIWLEDYILTQAEP